MLKLKFDLTPYFPPEMDLAPERGALCAGLLLAAFHSTGFLLRYTTEQQALLRAAQRRPLDASLMMSSFPSLLGSALNGFWIAAVLMLCFAFWHYAYFRQGSKSIYLMRRLPDRWELWRRCMTLPVLGALACVLVGGLFFALYAAVYFTMTPPQFLPPHPWLLNGV